MLEGSNEDRVQSLIHRQQPPTKIHSPFCIQLGISHPILFVPHRGQDERPGWQLQERGIYLHLAEIFWQGGWLDPLLTSQISLRVFFRVDSLLSLQQYVCWWQGGGLILMLWYYIMYLFLFIWDMVFIFLMACPLKSLFKIMNWIENNSLNYAIMLTWQKEA